MIFIVDFVLVDVVVVGVLCEMVYWFFYFFDFWCMVGMFCCGGIDLIMVIDGFVIWCMMCMEFGFVMFVFCMMGVEVRVMVWGCGVELVFDCVFDLCGVCDDDEGFDVFCYLFIVDLVCCNFGFCFICGGEVFDVFVCVIIE